jgi:hypothetical protein
MCSKREEWEEVRVRIPPTTLKEDLMEIMGLS